MNLVDGARVLVRSGLVRVEPPAKFFRTGACVAALGPYAGGRGCHQCRAPW